MPPTNTTPTSQQLYERLYGMTENLPQIQRLPQIQSEDVIYQDLLKRAETFRPQYEELGRLEARAYETPSTYYKDLTRRYGEGVGKGLSAQGEIASMAGNIGRQLATTDTARRIIETQRGTLSDLAKTLYATRLQDQETMLRNMELERQRRSDEMNALAQLYQFQAAKEQLDLENKRLAGGLGGFQIQTPQATQDTSDGMHYNEQTGEFEYWDKGKRIQTFKTEKDADRFIYEFGKKAEQKPDGRTPEQKPDGRTPEEIRLSQLTPEQLQQERLAKYQQMRKDVKAANYEQMREDVRRAGLLPGQRSPRFSNY